MKWQEAEKRMLAGELLTARRFNYRIQKGKLHYFSNNEWEEVHTTYNNVVNTDWQPLPAKTYTGIEAIELCLREYRKFEDGAGQIILNIRGVLCTERSNPFTLALQDLDREWTEVIE